ncbi:MAG: hypothetical protein RI947_438 [Candidatus Parcubacteria bacterium]|jgi:hypothetical protein
MEICDIIHYNFMKKVGTAFVSQSSLQNLQTMKYLGEEVK